MIQVAHPEKLATHPWQSPDRLQKANEGSTTLTDIKPSRSESDGWCKLFTEHEAEQTLHVYQRRRAITVASSFCTVKHWQISNTLPWAGKWGNDKGLPCDGLREPQDPKSPKIEVPPEVAQK